MIWRWEKNGRYSLLSAYKAAFFVATTKEEGVD
jgi:hypothetical protein